MITMVAIPSWILEFSLAKEEIPGSLFLFFGDSISVNSVTGMLVVSQAERGSTLLIISEEYSPIDFFSKFCGNLLIT